MIYSIQEAMTEKEKRLFAENFENYSRGALVSEDYLHRAHVYFIILNKNVVGGFCLNHSKPFRYWEWQSKLESFPIFSEAMEWTCQWKKPDLSKTKGLIMLLFIAYHIKRELKQKKKSCVIAGTYHKKLATTQNRALPHVLYEGPMTLYPEKVCKIMMARQKGGYFLILKVFILEIFNRALKDRKNKKASSSRASHYKK